MAKSQPEKVDTNVKTGITTQKRTKFQEFLRKAVRRKSCSYILLANIILFILLVLAIGGIVYKITLIQADLSQYAKEDKIIKKRQDEITFQHCPYKDPSPYYTNYCSENSGALAFAWREKKLEWKMPTCLDWIEQVKCHDSLTTKLSPRTGITQCAGVFNQPMLSGSGSKNQAPAVTKDILQQNLNKVVLANQLVVRCPQCTVQTNVFQFKGDVGNCYRKLSTATNGWPAEFYFCDLFQKEANGTTCNETVLEIQNPLNT